MLTAYGADPAWWTSRGAVLPPEVTTNSGVVTTNYVSNDFAVVTQGQLKQFTVKAVDELNTGLTNNGGAGTNLNNLVQSWALDYATNGYSATNIKPSDYSAMNVGQLKYTGHLIWTPLVSVGYTNAAPGWLALNTNSDNALAIIGQLKTIFNFDIPPPPAAMGNFTAYSPTNGTISLNWSLPMVNNANSILVQQSTDGGANWTTLTNLAATNNSYTVLGLNTRVSYSYQLIASNSGGTTAVGLNAGSPTPGIALPPRFLTGVFVVDGLQLNWSAAPGATSYIIERQALSSGTWSTLATGVTSPTYLDTSYDTLGYHYRVRSQDSEGTSEPCMEYPPFRYAVIDLGTNFFPTGVNAGGVVVGNGLDSVGSPVEGLKWEGDSRTSFGNRTIFDINDANHYIYNLPVDIDPRGGAHLGVVDYILGWSMDAAVESTQDALGYPLNSYPMVINNVDHVGGEAFSGYHGTNVLGYAAATLAHGATWTGIAASGGNPAVPHEDMTWLNTRLSEYPDGSILEVATDGWIYSLNDNDISIQYRRYYANVLPSSPMEYGEGYFINGVLVPDGFLPMSLNNGGVVVGDSGGHVHSRQVGASPGADVDLGIGHACFINNATPPQILGARDQTSWAGRYITQNTPMVWTMNPDASDYRCEGVNDLLPIRSSWTVESVAKVNKGGAIVGTAISSDASIATGSHGVMLLPASFKLRDSTKFVQGWDGTGWNEENNNTDKPHRTWVAVGATNSLIKLMLPENSSSLGLELAVAADSTDYIELLNNSISNSSTINFDIKGKTATPTVLGSDPYREEHFYSTVNPRPAHIELRTIATHQILLTLDVIVLAPRTVEIDIDYLDDSLNTASLVPSSAPSAEDIITQLNNVFQKQANVTFHLHNSRHLNVSNAFNSNGELEFHGEGAALINQPKPGEVIDTAILGVPAGNVTLCIIKGLKDLDPQNTNGATIGSTWGLQSVVIYNAPMLTFIHEMGHILGLSSKFEDQAHAHDLGPWPREGEELNYISQRGLMFPSVRGTGSWIRSQDWSQANEQAFNISN